jgi:uncharacterized membrane protein
MDMEFVRRKYGLDLRHIDVGPVAAWSLALGGLALVLLGAGRRSGPAVGAGAAVIGGTLVYHGATKDRPALRSLPRRRYTTTSIHRAVNVNRPAHELYRIWRDFENLPRFMRQLEAVEALDARRSRWVARAPGGFRLEWRVEVVEAIEGRRIAWRSLPGSDLNTSGAVSFVQLPGGRRTLVDVDVRYSPPGGRAGAAVARLFSRSAEQQLRDNLRRFKQLAEAGQLGVADDQSRRRATSQPPVISRQIQERP